MLLHIKISRLKKPEAERTMQETLDSKSVRFDVYTSDSKRIFDIEIQTTNNKNLPKRARYYQSVIDLDNLSKGTKYSKLKDSYVIFLCLEPPFRKVKPVYFFENLCRDNPEIKLNDRAYKVFFIAVSVSRNSNTIRTAQSIPLQNVMEQGQSKAQIKSGTCCFEYRRISNTGSCKQ